MLKADQDAGDEDGRQGGQRLTALALRGRHSSPSDHEQRADNEKQGTGYPRKVQ